MLNLDALFANAKNLSEKFQLNPCFCILNSVLGVLCQIMFHDVFTPSQFKITVDACFFFFCTHCGCYSVNAFNKVTNSSFFILFPFFLYAFFAFSFFSCFVRFSFASCSVIFPRATITFKKLSNFASMMSHQQLRC